MSETQIPESTFYWANESLAVDETTKFRHSDTSAITPSEQIEEEFAEGTDQAAGQDHQSILDATRSQVEDGFARWKNPSDRQFDDEKSLEDKGSRRRHLQRRPLPEQNARLNSASRTESTHTSRRAANTTPPIIGEVLAGAQAYSATVASELPSDDDIRKIEAKAREGSYEARSRLTEICLHRTWRRALRLSAFYRALRGVELDPQDIAQEGALRAWKRLDKALTHPNPYGYLCLATEGAMLTFCRERQTAVRVPVTMQWRGHPPVEVVSLDAPLTSDNMETLADILPSESEQA